MGEVMVQTVLCMRRVRPQRMETKARRRARETTTSFKAEVIRSVDHQQDETKGDVHFSPPLLSHKRESQQPMRYQQPRMVMTTLSKRRLE